MSLLNSLRGEFIDIIEYLASSPDVLSHRFERHDNEIKMGAKLIVRPGQVAVFINEGQFADLFTEGTHTLSTQNLPVLSTLKGWKYLFDSPFKAEVIFITTLQLANRKWGTQNPILMRDSELGAVRIRAFGTYAYRIEEPKTFFTALVGTQNQVGSEAIETQLKSMLVSVFSDTLAELKISAFDVAAKYMEIGDAVKRLVKDRFSSFGLEATQLIVENISLPPEVERLVDKRSGMGVIGNADAYLKFNVADKAGEALTQPGGLAGTFAGAGAGLAMGAQIAGQFASAMSPGAAAAVPPPLPSQIPGFHVALDGKQQGPFDHASLSQMTMTGKMTRETLVWRAGMAQWTKAQDVPDLANLLNQVPPPLPG